MDNLRIRPMRPDEIALAVDWAAAEGWNPGFADDACFASVDPVGFFIAESTARRSRPSPASITAKFCLSRLLHRAGGFARQGYGCASGTRRSRMPGRA